MSDQTAEIYIDAKQGAQILNNVSIRTFYRYLDKAPAELTVQTTTQVVNDHAVKMYRKADIVRLAQALNKNKTVITYVAQNVRPPADIEVPSNKPAVVTTREFEDMADLPGIPANARFSLTAKTLLRLYFSTLVIGLLILALGLTITALWLDKEFHRQSRQISSLKSYIAHKKI